MLILGGKLSQFFWTTNLKGKSILLLIEEFLWFIAADVEPKTPTPTLTAQIVALPSTRLVNATLEVTENTTDE